jgi:hypothetical protein
MALKLAYEDDLVAQWRKYFPTISLIKLARLLEDQQMVDLVHIAFEAGRTWQARHPTATLDAPNYESPEIAKT